MNIKFSKSGTILTFDKIATGQIFRRFGVREVLYMKVSFRQNSKQCAIDLESGSFYTFSDNEEIELVNGSFVEE